MLLRAAVLSAEWQITSVHSRNAEMVCAAELLTRRPQAFFLFFLSETLRRYASSHACICGRRASWSGFMVWGQGLVVVRSPDCGVDDQIVIVHAIVPMALLPPFRRRRGT